MNDLIRRYDAALMRYPILPLESGFPYIERAGSGQTLVLLHPTLGTPHIFFTLFENLPDDVRIISFYMPDELELHDFSTRFEASCQALGLHNVIVMGASIGGYVAQFIAASPFVKALILCSTMTSLTHMGIMPEDHIDALSALDQAGILQSMYQPMVALWPAQTPLLSHVNDLILTRIAPYMPAARFMSRTRFVFHHRKAPAMILPQSQILILDSDDDPTIDVATRADMAARYPQAKHITFKAGGQYPYLVHEVAFAEAIDAFMNSLS